ncbi:hypothetical protein GJ496_009380 [Pomphorhynchus laevis]|nr:hypothetical protein GJ496_009380 [Pomphorhynchus laevis]
MFQQRIVIPEALHRCVLRILHEGHPGEAAMKTYARYYVWWPRLDNDIHNYVASCYDCQIIRPAACELPLYNWDFIPESQAKCADLYHLCGKNNIWKWTAEHDKAFEVVKEAMLDARGTQELVQCRSTEFGQSMTMKRETDQIDHIISTNKSNAQTWEATNKPQSSCTRCGRQHTRFQRCPVTRKTCRRCGKIGHFETCCRSTNTPTHNNVRAVEMVSDNDSEILRSINTIGHDDIIPFIKVQINWQCINMEFDTRASVSNFNSCLVTHRRIDITYSQRVENLRPLFGRPWISAFKLKWPESVITIREQDINSSPLCSIKATYEKNKELYNLLQNYAEVFGPGTTHVKDYEVELTIDNNAIPHCWGSRRVPFSLRESVEAELQRQLKQGVIEPVDTSQEIVDWAAPIVVTHKSDGSIACKRVLINWRLYRKCPHDQTKANYDPSLGRREVAAAAAQSIGKSSCNLTANSDKPLSLNTC